jgi:hypothetical protein
MSGFCLDIVQATAARQRSDELQVCFVVLAG